MAEKIEVTLTVKGEVPVEAIKDAMEQKLKVKSV